MAIRLTALSSWTTAWVNSAIAVMSGFLYRQNATPLVTEPKNSVSKFNNEMLSYLAPIIPGIFFTAIQGQIAVLLITLFGQTKSIAEVAALGRLSQLFTIVTTSNYVIIEPYIAKVDRQHLVKRYFQILGVALAISLVLCATAFFFPQPVLWILGPKYQDLQAEVGWTVVASCLSYLGTVMWAMHTARKWVYWWYTALHIMLLLIVQIVSVAVMDLSTTLNVIYFSIITASSIILVHIIAGVHGLINVAKVEQ